MMTRPPDAALLAALLALGCSGAAPPVPGAGGKPAPPAGREEPGAARSEGEPARLPPPSEGPAPWLDREEPRRRHVLGVAGEVRLGERAALVQTWAGWFAVHLERGAIGPLSLPSDAAWVGIGGGDAVLVADKGGQLWAAARPEDALPGGRGLSKRGAVPGAAVWDAAGDVVAAGASWDEVFLSADGGRSFRKTSLGEGLRVAEIYARADGAALARARPLDAPGEAAATYVAPPGRRFQRSAFQPERVDRTGSWIWSGADCPVVLAADGVHWVARDVYSLAELDPWSDMLDRVYQVRARAPSPLLTAADPPPPRYRRERDGAGDGSCEEDEDEAEEAEPGEEGAGGISLDQCRGLSCLGAIWPAEPLRGRSPLALLSDGRCARARDADKDGWCGPGAELARAPQAVERTDPRPIRLPEACPPSHVLSGPGLGLLFCEAGGATEVWALDRSRSWRREGTLATAPDRVRRLLAAGDGTLLVGRPCSGGGRCRAFLRRPMSAGAEGAWREVDVEGALAYRPVAGGRALAVARRGPESSPPKVRITLHGPGDAVRVLAEEAAAPGDASGVEIEDGAVVFLGGSRLEPRRHVLGEDGRLHRR